MNKVKYVEVGSYYLWNNKLCSSFNDIDIWATHEDNKIKSYYTHHNKVVDLKVMPEYIIEMVNTYQWKYKPLDIAYTIKCSHLGWDNPMWSKHKKDILNFKIKGAKILEPLYAILVEYWEDELGKKEFLSLNKNKYEFFTDNVTYKFDHDELHEYVASPHKPLYRSYLREGSEVLLDKESVLKQPVGTVIELFRREIQTICLERWLLNDYYLKTDITINEAHQLAVKKVITRLTKGWATDFVIRYLDKFILCDYELYLRVINKLLTTKERKKYMKDEKAIEIFKKEFTNQVFSKGFFATDLESYIRGIICGDNVDLIKLEDNGQEDTSTIVFSMQGTILKSKYYMDSYGDVYVNDFLNNLKVATPVTKTITVYE